MNIRLVWNGEPVGVLDMASWRPQGIAGIGSLSVLQLSSGNRELALCLPFSGFGDGIDLELAHPTVAAMARDEAGIKFVHIHGPMRADFDGPRFTGHIRADLDGPGIDGYIRADLDGPGLLGHIRAHLHGPGLRCRIRAELRGAGFDGYIRIRTDVDDTSLGGRLRAYFDGPGLDGYIHADLDGPDFEGRIWGHFHGRGGFGEAEIDLERVGSDDAWAQALRALLRFIVKHDGAHVVLVLAVYPGEIPALALSMLSPRLRQALTEHLVEDRSLSPSAARAYYLHRDHFEKLAQEAPAEAARALTTDATGHVLSRVPLEADEPPRDPVRLGVSCPWTAPLGANFVTTFVAYHPDLEELVKKQLESKDPKAIPQLDCHRETWQRGTQVQVVVHGQFFEVDPQSDKFVWNGEKEQIDFHVRVLPTAPVARTVLKTDVYVEGIRIKRIWLPFEVTAQGSETGRAEMSGSSAPLSGFISYASTDRPRVLDRVASLIIRTGMNVLMDCVTLRPNQKWRALIPQLIIESDLLLLFWSEAAKKSEWVDWEWRHAVEHKGMGAVEIHPLTPYSSAPLPPELSELHSGDPFMVYREWEMNRATQSSSGGRPLMEGGQPR